ncbi:zf-HC2 domain-containing protein [Psychrobacter pygoscelis]|uniref:zf-HC2 domain-containing protein n=1 Tax=Psychrobacter pygoscelis TaxID=2488563 RepID=UPI00103D3DD1|nr:zf-HC2 domain-containing protein [Psychrobacter pygoscelis]
MKNCQQITQLASDAQDRQLRTREKLQLYSHIMMCQGCRAFYKNIDTLSQMMQTMKSQSHDINKDSNS